jgi:hypothetical protein
MRKYGIRCASNILIRSVRNVDGDYLYWTENDCEIGSVNNSSGQLLEV